MPFARLADVTLHHAVRPAAPRAPTLLFANSLGTDFRIWDAVVAALPADLGIVRYDKRGHGLSDLAPGNRLEHHVGDVVALADHLGLGRIVMVGLSVGGVIAQGLARQHPERVAGLVLACTAAKVGTDASWNERIAAVRGPGLAAIADTVMERWFSPAFRATETATLGGMVNMLVRQPADGYAAICEMLRDTDLRDAASGIAVPTLCVAGSADGSTPPDLVRGLAETIPGAEFVVIDGAGHIPCVEAPEVFAGHVARFLARRDLLHA
jgi:3-oxoadipate enol-lactonase